MDHRFGDQAGDNYYHNSPERMSKIFSSHKKISNENKNKNDRQPDTTYRYHMDVRAYKFDIDDPMPTPPPQTGDVIIADRRSYEVLWTQGRTVGAKWIN